MTWGWERELGFDFLGEIVFSVADLPLFAELITWSLERQFKRLNEVIFFSSIITVKLSMPLGLHGSSWGHIFP